MKNRVSQHHSRTGKSWHNDRDFSNEVPEHIDQSKTKFNKTWQLGSDDVTFEQTEFQYYQFMFEKMLDLQNEKYRKNRHEERQKTMEQFMKCNRYKPEETIFQIGDKDNCPCYDNDILEQCFTEYLSWEKSWSEQHNNCIQVLDYALHMDEPGAPHVHCREVWQYQDDNGVWKIGQDEALKRAGVPLYDETQPKGQHNNRKKTFDEMRREKWMDICEEHGIDVERVPRKRKHLEKSDFIEQKEKEQERLEQDVEDLTKQKNDLKEDVKTLQEQKKSLSGDIDRKKRFETSLDEIQAKSDVINKQSQTNSRGRQAEEQLGVR